MNRRVRAAVLAAEAALFMVWTSNVSAQPAAPHYRIGERAFLEGRWSDAIKNLTDDWDSDRRSWQAAYYLGASYCNRAAPRYDTSNSAAWFYQAGQFRSADRALIDDARSLCRNQSVVRERVTIRSTRTITAELLYFGANAAIRYRPLETVEPIPVETIAARLAPIGDAARIAGSTEAMRNALRRSSQYQGTCARERDFRTYTIGRFLFMTRADVFPDMLKPLAATLEAYVMDIHARFGLALPKQMISIHLARCALDMQVSARQLHGLDFHDDAYKGYSVLDDMSLAATWDGLASRTPGQLDGEMMRTLRHEIAHLVVGSAYPNAPGWLDEGLAQYMGIIADDPAFGHKTVVASSWGRDLPSLHEAIAPAEVGTGTCLTYARRMLEADVARMFLAWVDDEPGRLARLIATFRGYAPGEGAPLDDVALIEKALGAPFAEVEARYRAASEVRYDDTLFGDVTGETCPT